MLALFCQFSCGFDHCQSLFVLIFLFCFLNIEAFPARTVSYKLYYRIFGLETFMSYWRHVSQDMTTTPMETFQTTNTERNKNGNYIYKNKTMPSSPQKRSTRSTRSSNRSRSKSTARSPSSRKKKTRTPSRNKIRTPAKASVTTRSSRSRPNLFDHQDQRLTLNERTQREMQKLSGFGKDNDDDNPRSAKPVVVSAPPPWHSVLVSVLVGTVSFMNLPTMQSIDSIATIETFTVSVLPNIPMLYLGVTRCLIAAFFTVSTVVRLTRAEVKLMPVYRPNTKLSPKIIRLDGLRRLYFFTWWSFLLLTLSFLSSGTIPIMVSMGMEEQISPWLLRFALVSFEISTPVAFLVSSAVRYALWPAVLNKRGPTGTTNFTEFDALVSHNANVIFIMAEVCLLGGLPIVMEHMSIVPLYCLSYTLFSWFMANRWLPNGGPQYLYFFLDTTLGWTTSIALLLLCIVLLTFYIFFAKMSILGDNYLGEDLLVRLVATVGLSSLVCRFRN